MAKASKAWYSTSEVAQLLAVQRRTVCRWIHTGRLAATRLGGHYRIRWEELQRAIEQSCMRAQLSLEAKDCIDKDSTAAWQRLRAGGLA